MPGFSAATEPSSAQPSWLSARVRVVRDSPVRGALNCHGDEERYRSWSVGCRVGRVAAADRRAIWAGRAMTANFGGVAWAADLVLNIRQQVISSEPCQQRCPWSVDGRHPHHRQSPMRGRSTLQRRHALEPSASPRPRNRSGRHAQAQATSRPPTTDTVRRVRGRPQGCREADRGRPDHVHR